MYQDDFCVRNGELLSRRFLQKSQIYKYITPQIIALFRSRPPNQSINQSINHLLRHNKGLQGLKINTLYITTQIYNTIIRHREARPIYL